MTHVFLLIALTVTGCLAHAHPRHAAVEAPDPEVGDMGCAPAMSIHSLLESWHQPISAEGCGEAP